AIGRGAIRRFLNQCVGPTTRRARGGSPMLRSIRPKRTGRSSRLSSRSPRARWPARFQGDPSAEADPDVRGSCEDFGDRLALLHDPHGPPEDGQFHLLVVEAELAEDRRMQVAVVMRALDRLVTNVVGGAVDGPTLDAAAGQPGRVAPRVVVS